MAIRIPCGAKHRPVPEGPEGERIATAFGLAMTRKIEPGPSIGGAEPDTPGGVSLQETPQGPARRTDFRVLV